MSNGLYQQDYTGYQDKKGSLKLLSDEKWAYQNLPYEVQGVTDEEEVLEECMDKQRRTLAGCSMYCPNKKPAFPPAVPFYEVKEQIMKNKLFQKIFRKMPKGGLLHVHSAAALSVEGLIELLEKWNRDRNDENKQVRIVNQDISGQEHRYVLGTLLYAYQCKEIEGYTIPLEEYLQEKGNREKLMEMLSFRNRKVEAVPYIWDEFNRIFSRTSELFKDKEFYIQYHVSFFQECLDDNIRYVEMRCGFETFTEPQENGYISRKEDYMAVNAFYFKDMLTEVNVDEPNMEFIEAILEAKERVRSKNPNRSFEVRIILNAQRSLDPTVSAEQEKLCKRVDAAIKIKQHYMDKGQEVVIGFDFVGEEDRGQTTDVYANKVIYQPVGYGYGIVSDNTALRIKKIHFFLHDGESNWYFNDNLRSAAIVSKHRIGHGINMNKLSEVMSEIAKEEQTQSVLIEPVLEICPISNQLLRYYEDIRSHSMYELVKNGVMCVIANDDPQILGNPGLSFDFWEAYVGMGMSMQMLKMVIFITYLYEFTDYDKGNMDLEGALNKFLVDWKNFLENLDLFEIL